MVRVNLCVWHQLVLMLLLLAPATGFGKQQWPKGTYGLPMPSSSCPLSDDFEWNTGKRTHKTEYGSHSSRPTHLAEMNSDKANRIVQSFCIKTTYAGNGEWEPGRYCIFKKGDCPAGFSYGYIYWDDAAPWIGSTIQSYEGTLPDGKYDRNTKVYYCCREDGNPFKDITLPNALPFYLFKKGDHCQEVAGMKTSEEYLFWMDETFVTLGSKGGSIPEMRRQKYPQKFTQVYYCYYEKGGEKPSKTMFVVIISLSSIFGIGVVVVMVICLVQRILFCRKAGLESEDGDDNAENASREHMLSQAAGTSPEVSGVYPHSDTGAAPPTGNLLALPVQSPPYKPYLTQGEMPGDLPPSYSDTVGELDQVQAGEEAWSAANAQPTGQVSAAACPVLPPQPPSYDDVLKEDNKYVEEPPS